MKRDMTASRVGEPALDGSAVDFAGLAAWYEHERGAVLDVIDATLGTGMLLNGSKVAQLEQLCAAVLGRRHAVAVASGTDALVIALRCANVGPGDEVIVTSFSFIASASSIALVGATPVFVDLEPATLLMDHLALADAVSSRTRAVLAVDLFGRCGPALELESFARQNGLLLVKDSAQSFGVIESGRPAAACGDLGVVSFDPTKVLGGIGAGGVVTMDDINLAERARRLRVHGHDQQTGDFVAVGLNSRLAEVNAAVLSHGISRYGEWAAARARVAAAYQDSLSGIPGLAVLHGKHHDVQENHHKFVVRTRRRDELRNHLARHGVPTKVHYARALPDHPALAGVGRVVGGLPQARAAAREVLSLPIHPYISPEQVDRIVTLVRAFPW